MYMNKQEQQEQINMLIELANNLTESVVELQKYNKKIEKVVALQKIVCQRLDYIEDFLNQNFGKEEEDEEERIIN